MGKLEVKGNLYTITNKKNFEVTGKISSIHVQKSFDFAFDMSFGEKGFHRSNRSGGKNKRKNGEIFCDAFQGKLAEFALYEYAKEKGIEFDEPDLQLHEQGIWDSYDFRYKEIKIAVKSTKHYGQLLLLEKKDWNEKGEYIPNQKRNAGEGAYDYFVMIRIKPSIQDILKNNKLLYKNRVLENGCSLELEDVEEEKQYLKDILIQNSSAIEYEYDIPGVISRRSLVHIIKEKYILPQGAKLGSSEILMDATNYYIQLGDFKDIQELIDKLKKIE